MRGFLPPDTDDLRAKLVARNAWRARALVAPLRRWIERAAAERRTSAARREALRLLEAVLRSVRGRERERLFYSPGMRAWLALSEEGLALVDPGASPLDLFERIASGPHLPRLLPRGRLDVGFPRRAAHLGEEMLARALQRLPPLLSFLAPSGQRYGPFPLDLDEDAEEGREHGELHVSAPAPLTLILPRGARLVILGQSTPDRSARVRAVSDREPGTHTGGPSIGFLARGDIRSIEPDCIPGSGIVVRRRARWTRRGTVAGPHIRGAARRLGEALALLDEAWPEAGDEVRAQTFEVVPLVERSTVSYSLPSRPGVSFINLHGKSLVDLADDLLHESAHHRLHGLEEIEGPLDRDDGEPRYWSPWRRSVRPVHGILHAAYTFTWRAALLARLLAVDRKLPKRWLRREMEAEIRMLDASLVDLGDARKRGLLTPAGRSLVQAISRRLPSLEPP